MRGLLLIECSDFCFGSACGMFQIHVSEQTDSGQKPDQDSDSCV